MKSRCISSSSSSSLESIAQMRVYAIAILTTRTFEISVADPDIPFRGGGGGGGGGVGHEMRLNAKGIVWSFVGRKLLNI